MPRISRMRPFPFPSFIVKKVLFILLLVILLFALFTRKRHSAKGPDSNPVAEQLWQKLNTTAEEIESLRRTDEQSTATTAGGKVVSNDSDILHYENTRWQLDLGLKELYYNVKRKKDVLGEKDYLAIVDIYRLLRSHVSNLRKSDGFESFREKEAKELADIMQDRISRLQNPKNCTAAKKAICNLNKGCGFGCQIHHVLYCLVAAYATGRTLIFESEAWSYNSRGWEAMFLPLSKTCNRTTEDESRSRSWSDVNINSKAQVLSLPVIDFLYPLPNFIPNNLPKDIAKRLMKVHGQPQIWWAGQFIKYILRPQPHIWRKLKKSIWTLVSSKRGPPPGPLVGIHVRRTDKIPREAQFHELKEYMDYAEDYFAIKDMERPPGSPPLPRRVFIASDDPSVIKQAKEEYGCESTSKCSGNKKWEVRGDQKVALSAGLGSRYHSGGAMGIIRDVFLLAECDFLVCTFSSQVCRLAYELLQTKHVDGSWRAQSLDDIYYYGGNGPLHQKVILPHEPLKPEEIKLSPGDDIEIAGNHWDGFSAGRNVRTGERGLYPSYKAKDDPVVADFPKDPWWSDST